MARQRATKHSVASTNSFADTERNTVSSNRALRDQASSADNC
jgi:hypothetical protein